MVGMLRCMLKLLCPRTSLQRAAMAPMVLECVVDGCQFATQELEQAVAVELIKLHDKYSHTQVMGGSPTEGRCQTGQLNCLGQKPDSSCGLCYNHSCLGQRPDIKCDLCHNHIRSCPRVKKLISWCKGEVCK